MASADIQSQIPRLAIVWLTLSVLVLVYRQPLLASNKQTLAGFFARLLSAWLLGAILAIRYSGDAASYMVDYLALAANALQYDFHVALRIYPARPDFIHCVATSLRDAAPVAVGTELQVFIGTDRLAMPVAFLFALLCAWPVPNVRARILLTLLSLPLTVFYLCLSGPFHVVGFLENIVQILAKLNHVERPEPPYYIWQQFLDGGGCWLLVLALAGCGKWIVSRNAVQLAAAR
ncbi:hypothetical protein [Methylomonas rivi]|uniref:Exosortase K n=1 Tax=Methylomonas rivi TaxID=2952226 RepID=A0ABT1U8T6_9GAMM|nr:hypothetical protein [Methylomonas sp. WSC-6]MCQ8130274.1 hypothetical protein [Methylomonas sp. WSC-6]